MNSMRDDVYTVAAVGRRKVPANVQRAIGELSVRKLIVVPNKIVNIVVG